MKTQGFRSSSIQIDRTLMCHAQSFFFLFSSLFSARFTRACERRSSQERRGEYPSSKTRREKRQRRRQRQSCSFFYHHVTSIFSLCRTPLRVSTHRQGKREREKRSLIKTMTDDEHHFDPVSRIFSREEKPTSIFFFQRAVLHGDDDDDKLHLFIKGLPR